MFANNGTDNGGNTSDDRDVDLVLNVGLPVFVVLLCLIVLCHYLRQRYKSVLGPWDSSARVDTSRDRFLGDVAAFWGVNSGAQFQQEPGVELGSVGGGLESGLSSKRTPMLPSPHDGRR